jgi:N-acyl-phosphatidylethanolamine-hydrolysing phospholipase D
MPGDTGYRTVTEEDAGKDESTLPHCPAFAEIGERYGPFDLALLPVGCYTPRTFMSSVHCAPEDSICIHKDVKSKKSLGMHYGTIRGGLSAQYEDVRDPPKRWKECCDRAGLKWGEEIVLCDIGETVAV